MEVEHTEATVVSRKDGAVWYARPPPPSAVVGTIHPVFGKCCTVCDVPSFCKTTSCINSSRHALCCFALIWLNVFLNLCPLPRGMTPKQHWQKGVAD